VLVAVVGWGKWPYPFLLQVYATGAVVITLNAIRTAAAHRWRGDRQRVMSTQAQVLDSVTIGSDSLLAVIISPVGLRYHALHHMFPSLPYHNLREAHRRLMAQLAPDSPYRATVEPSVIAAVAKLRPGST
jgi:fatty acid desaturase